MREHSGEFLCLRWVWVDVGIDPYEFFSGLSGETGIVTGGNPRRGRTSASDTLRWQVSKHWDYGLRTSVSTGSQ